MRGEGRDRERVLSLDWAQAGQEQVPKTQHSFQKDTSNLEIVLEFVHRDY